jgi:hypothetical protein
MCALLDDPAKSSVVLDRELDEEKNKGPSDPRIRCPLCGRTPRKEDRWFCDCGREWNTFDTGGRVPRLPPPVGFDAVSLVASGLRIRIGTRTDALGASALRRVAPS